MNSSPPSIGTPAAKAALQALGKRIIENSTLYHFGKGDVVGGEPESPVAAGNGNNVQQLQVPPKKQKLEAKGIDNNKIKEEPTQRDPYLSYEQYENLLYRGKQMHHEHPQLSHQLPKLEESSLNEQIPIDSLISELPYDDDSSSSVSLSPPIPHTLPPILPSLSSSLASSLGSSMETPQLSSPLTHTITHSLSPITTTLLTPASPPTSVSPSTQLTLTSSGSISQPPTPPNSAHAVTLLSHAENLKIQRKKANTQEREVLEKYYNDHYVDQAVKIRKEDLTELAFSLNWHVLRVQGWMHTHRQSRSDYNPPKRTKRRATLPQEQDLLKHYFKIWTEQGLIDFGSATRVTPKDYEGGGRSSIDITLQSVAAQLGWDNERVRRWTDHYKQKIKAATEGNS